MAGAVSTPVVGGLKTVGVGGQALPAAVWDQAFVTGGVFIDLNLSAYVGARKALCYFEVINAGDIYAIKPKGSGDAFANHSGAAGSWGVGIFDSDAVAGNVGYVVAMTDANGYCQHACAMNTQVKVNLIGFVV